VGKVLSKYTISKKLPVPFQESNEICKKYLPLKHPVPKFFKLQEQAVGSVGREELKEAYNEIHEFYEDFWLSEAGGPILDLIKKIAFKGKKRIFEAGCGTGFATVLLADKIKNDGAVVAADISRGMLIEADKHARSEKLGNINFVCGDALEILDKEKPFDLVFSSWVLGYIPLKPFFKAVSESLTKRGELGFVVHKENSPREPMEIFGEIIAENPAVLLKQVKFDFPRDIAHIKDEIKSAGMKIKKIWDGKIVFRYDSAEKVLKHLLKSGAGTAFYNAIDPQKRSSIEKKFLKKLSASHKAGRDFEVIHDYISCVALKP
jgi:SAM-dependent methyltransferase